MLHTVGVHVGPHKELRGVVKLLFNRCGEIV